MIYVLVYRAGVDRPPELDFLSQRVCQLSRHRYFGGGRFGTGDEVQICPYHCYRILLYKMGCWIQHA